MIVITGAAGFIGSCIAAELNERGQSDLILVDELGTNEKWKNLRNLAYNDYLESGELFQFLSNNMVEAVIHMGACSSTTERDASYFYRNNYRYTEKLAEHCITNNVRFVYASSAATYGDGSLGFDDDESKLGTLQPLNMYGYSKQMFDLKARREGWLDRIAGVKFFNVYGPNEYHKDDMASVVFKAFNQILETGAMRLFKSDREGIGDGEQARDFVYVKDVVAVVLFLLDHPEANGIFNSGAGVARTFKDLVLATFAGMDLEPKIEFFDMPEKLKGKYQYYTKANMEKIRAAGMDFTPHTLEDGIGEYVREFLAKDFRHW